MANTYCVDVVCMNCGKKLEVDVDKGNTVAQFCSKNSCPNCECFQLTRDENPGRENTYWDLIV
jgi:hypothetical protein